MKRPSKADIEAAIISGMNIKQSAAHFNVCTKTMELWRKKYGITIRAERRPRKKTVDYKKVDRLLGDPTLSEHRIATLCRCSIMTVSNRWRVLFPNQERRLVEKYSSPRDPTFVNFVDPRKRLEIAIEKKAKRLNMPMEWMLSTWLPNQPGFVAEFAWLSVNGRAGA